MAGAWLPVALLLLPPAAAAGSVIATRLLPFLLAICRRYLPLNNL
jgi:hypothetical protein